MLKLLATTLLLSSLVQADSTSEKIESFLEKTYSANGNLKSVDVKITNEIQIKEEKGWKAYFVDINAVIKRDNRKAKQQMVWFSNGEVLSKELFSLNSGKAMKDLVSIEFKDEYYKKENLIYGNADARNKVVIFSDPLCPFCRNFVPKVIKDMKTQPDRYAIYYYHLPLESLHPAAVELVKAAVVLEKRGVKDVALNLYKVEVNAREKDVKKILKAFNEVMGSNLTPKDIESKELSKKIEKDLEIAEALMVSGTPTMFLNGKVDKSKRKYKEAK
jgi:hypothetical protein